MTDAAPAPQPVSMVRFILSEVALVFAPAHVVLAAMGGTGAELLSATTAVTSTSTAVVSSTASPLATHKAVLKRRLVALWYSMGTVVLPLVPPVVAVVQAIRGDGAPVPMILLGIVMFVPSSLAGLIVTAKLTPMVFRLLGVTTPATTQPATTTTTTATTTTTTTTTTTET